MTGFVPARLSIFKLAFSHKSNQATRDFAQTNNERLEYLGDAVLGTIVAEYLFKKYPNGDEGFLTKMRSKIVKRKSLNYIGDQMGLDVLLTEYNRTRLSSSMLGNAVEALVGAVYLEKGYRGTERFVIQRMLKLYVDMHELETVDDNYKSQLLEYCQKNGMQVTYKLLNKFKQDRRDRFKVAVLVNGEQVSLADDFNKKSAEQLASLRALQKLGLINKVISKEDGLKSPSTKSKKEQKKPTRARSERRPQAPTKNTTDKKVASRSAEKPVANSLKRQATDRPTRGASNQPKKAVTKTQKQTSPRAKTTSAGFSKPARKQRRNNSRLGRSIWNGIQVSGTSIELVDELWYFADDTSSAPISSSIKQNKASAKTKQGNDTIIASGPKVSSRVKNSPEKRKEKTSAATKTKNTRVRRPIPLRVLTPIVKDASAVMAIDFGGLFGLEKSPKPKKVARKPRRKPAGKQNESSKLKSRATKKEKEANWEDTPLGLSGQHTPKVSKETPVRKLKPKGKRTSGAKTKSKVVTEKIDEWEDTLLEVNQETEAIASKLPKMYKTSNGKEPVGRKKPFHRKQPSKKTED